MSSRKSNVTALNLDTTSSAFNVSIVSMFFFKRLSDKLPNEIPVKMNTMQDKQNRVINFDDAVEVYNKWTSTTNSHMPISQEDIAQRVSAESKIYAT